MHRIKTLGHLLAAGGLVACGELSTLQNLERGPAELADPSARGAMEATRPLSAPSHALAHRTLRDWFTFSAQDNSYPGVQARGDVTAPVVLNQIPIDVGSDILLSATLSATLVGEYCDEEGGAVSAYLLSGPASVGADQGVITLRMNVRSHQSSGAQQGDDRLVVLEILEEALAEDSSGWLSDAETEDEGLATNGNDLVVPGADALAPGGEDSLGADVPGAAPAAEGESADECDALSAGPAADLIDLGSLNLASPWVASFDDGAAPALDAYGDVEAQVPQELQADPRGTIEGGFPFGSSLSFSDWRG